MPHTPPPACVGIDIGKAQLHVCIADPAQPDARKWRVQVIKYEDPAWFSHLAQMIPARAIIAAEPTGWHYFQPIVTVLGDRHIWQVGHQIVAAIRKTHLAKAKTDHIDSQALAMIARLISQDNPPRGCRPYHHEHFVEAHNLRMLLNEKRATLKQSTRLKNQLDALSHSVWPACAIRRDAFLTIFEEGIPRQPDLLLAIQIAASKNPRSTAIRQLANEIPAGLPTNPRTIQAIAARVPALRELEKKEARIDADISAALTSPQFAPIAARLLTVPTMDLDLIAGILVATDGDPASFTVSQFKAAIGTHPVNFQSGNVDRARAIKSGYRPAKALIFLLAQRLVNPKVSNPANPIAVYFARKQNISAARRKLTGMLWAIASREEGRWPQRPDPREMSTTAHAARLRRSKVSAKAAKFAHILAAANIPQEDSNA